MMFKTQTILLATAILLGPLPAFSSSSTDGLAQRLIEMADPAGLSISPDGSKAAFRIERSNIAKNDITFEWVVVALRGGPAKPRRIADGGDLAWKGSVRPNARNWGRSVQRPQWSPDGTSFLYLKRKQGATQVWQVNPDTGIDRQVTRGAQDVEEVRWAAGGRTLLLSVKQVTEASFREMLESESRNGYLLDPYRHFLVNDLRSQALPGQAWKESPTEVRAFDLAGGKLRDATDAEAAEFAAFDRRSFSMMGSSSLARTDDGGLTSAASLVAKLPILKEFPLAREVRRDANFQRLAWTDILDPQLQGRTAPLALRSWTATDGVVTCKAEACTGRVGGLALLGTDEVVFARREGWAYSQLAVYVWNTRNGSVRTVIKGDTRLSACDVSGRNFYCFREKPNLPAGLVRINLDTGSIDELYQSNQQLLADLPAAEKIEWQTALGEPCFGYFFPAKPRDQATPAPVVVVQYRATGFLRGGTGDEWPIALLVRNGISAFVVDRLESKDTNEHDYGKDRHKRQFMDLEYRWMPFRAIMSGLDLLEEKGKIDPRRIGMTGLSDGNQTAIFSITHSSRFTAASMPGLGEDSLMYYLGTKDYREILRDAGMDPTEPYRNYYLQQTMLAPNANRITTPILVHAADRELLVGMQNYVALDEAKRPIEMHVFADEFHQKWQPWHRAVIYERNVDWFRFWLLDEQDPSAQKQEQYRRWNRMRQQRAVALETASKPLPVPDWKAGERGGEDWYRRVTSGVPR